MPGTLYLIATPIGNLEDITLRALRILREVELVACEDTRQTQKLLGHYGLQKRTVSYHEHNENLRAPELIAELEKGANVALVSDAGTPLVSDPGYRLVGQALHHREHGAHRGLSPVVVDPPHDAPHHQRPVHRGGRDLGIQPAH
jgi:16S rRNA (cytidine1402-2'-O)-methyltransferase